ncbi:DNA polymerase phi domain-containing protein [Trichoderma breve]|uniref:DNA polymerase phi domain-containing protein n=1 Tax=Trichoderma breve TaxID=2034170 RepID=A0A9W9B8R3_9HYPO|nr:DNA polymerase phi domain-containing protein [Trichoderma breve]KAJ4858698.1 DNA polymerase phi domain-containing protein [Trichoderma breve]
MGSKRKRGVKEAPIATPNAQKKAKNVASPIVPVVAAAKPSLEKAPFVETPTIEERKREGLLYEHLGSEDDNDRIEAADCIISGLLGGEGVAEAVLQRHLDRRLFRGLASGRNASRIGFSLVITEILSQLFGDKEPSLAEKYSGLTFDKVLGFLLEKAQIVGNIPGQEERDIFFGQLFGIECFVKSRILFSEPSRWNTILEELLKLSNKKVWLKSQCGWVLVQALQQMDQAQAKSTLEKLSSAGVAKTPEGVAVWLVALNQFPDLKVKPWQHPLARKTLGDLTAILKESFNDSSKDPSSNSRNNQQASWTAQLHFVWDLILNHYLKAGDSEVEDFAHFWGRVLDDGLFSKQATDGQKFKGFTVFQKFLEGCVVHHSLLQILFSKNLMTSLMNQAAKEDRYLHRAAIKTLKAIEVAVSSHPSALVPVLESLLSRNGAYNFDQRTSTKTVDKLLQNFNLENDKGTLKIIQAPIASLSQQEVLEAQTILRVHIDYLSKVLGACASLNTKESQSNKLEGTSLSITLQQLSRLAYSQPDDIPKDALTEQIQELARSRLESALAKLTRQTSDFVTFCQAVASIDSSAVTMSEEIKAAIEGALSRMQKLLKQKTKTDNDKTLTQGLAMLHAISIFQLYNQDPDAMEVLDDLAQFHERLQEGKLGDDDTGSSEFLVEILLSMVARPSSLMRQVSQQVFEAFTSQISAGGLELLTGPLGTNESTRGQKELFNTEDDGMDVDGEDSDDDEDDDVEEISNVDIDSDVEFIGLADGEEADGDVEEDGEEDDEEDDEDSDDNDDEDEDDEEVDEKEGPIDLDELMGSILKSHRLDKDADAESSEDEGDMSDSQMFALEDKLAEVFKQRAKARPDSKKQKKDAKQSVVNFKHRILDFLDIYVRNEVLSPLGFAILIPLLNLMRTTTTKTLASRACEIILNYQRGMKKARSGNKDAAEAETTSTYDAEELLSVLVEVHEEAGKDNAHAYAKAASAASLIVASAMFASDKELVKRAAAVYAKTQSDWVLGQAKLQNSFFADWNNWCQNHASQGRN